MWGKSGEEAKQVCDKKVFATIDNQKKTFYKM